MFHWCVWIQRYRPVLFEFAEAERVFSFVLRPLRPVVKGTNCLWSLTLRAHVSRTCCCSSWWRLQTPLFFCATGDVANICPPPSVPSLRVLNPPLVEGTAEGLAGEVMFVSPCCSCASFSSHISHPFGRKAKYSLACFAVFLTVWSGLCNVLI